MELFAGPLDCIIVLTASIMELVCTVVGVEAAFAKNPNVLEMVSKSMVEDAVAGVVNTSEPDDPVVEPLVDCGFEPPISDVNTSITHSTKKFLSIVIVNSELTGKMNFKSHFCQKLIFKSAKVHNITKFPDFFLLNFRVCEPVHGSM